MKTLKLFFIATLFSLGQLVGQGEREYRLDNFTTVKAFNGIQVSLVSSEENKALVEGEYSDKVSFRNNGGVLKIRMKINKAFSGENTTVILYHREELKILDANEDARISSENVFVQSVLELKAQEGGEIELECDTEQLLIKTVTGGEINVRGTSRNSDVNVNTGGSYMGKEMKTEFTTVKVNAGGNAEVYAEDYVNAQVKAGGSILVYGNPEKMDEKTIFGGTILRKDE